jgi:hypothetical protein
MRILRQEIAVSFMYLQDSATKVINDKGALQGIDEKFIQLEKDIGEMQAYVMSQINKNEEDDLKFGVQASRLTFTNFKGPIVQKGTWEERHPTCRDLYDSGNVKSPNDRLLLKKVDLG